MTERVKLTIDDHVAIVTLDRPDKRNALDLPMFEALRSTGRRLMQEPGVRAVVLQGQGDHFCAGIDVSVFGSGNVAELGTMLDPLDDSPANLFQAAAYTWREVPVPVICALAGTVFGGGLQIALGADLRFAHPDARFSIMEIKWGLVPDMAITATLPRIMAVDKAKELAFTGRIVAGAEAEAIGLVTALHDDPKQAALDTARSIATQSPDAVRAIKRLLDRSVDLPVEAALRLEAELQLTVMGRPNQVEAVRANFERREPEFGDPPPGRD